MVKAPQFIGMGCDIAGIHIIDLPIKGVPQNGVRTILRLSEVQGHEGVAVTFFPAATREQRENLKRSVQSSSLVYKIIENAVPANVKRLD